MYCGYVTPYRPPRSSSCEACYPRRPPVPHTCSCPASTPAEFPPARRPYRLFGSSPAPTCDVTRLFVAGDKEGWFQAQSRFCLGYLRGFVPAVALAGVWKRAKESVEEVYSCEGCTRRLYHIKQQSKALLSCTSLIAWCRPLCGTAM